jgi:hypothetical protein
MGCLAILMGCLAILVVCVIAVLSRQDEKVSKQDENKALAAAKARSDRWDAAQAHCKTITKHNVRRHDVECLWLDCPDNSDELLRTLSNGNLAVGMDECLVRASLGKPDDVNTTVTARGQQEQWVYRASHSIYVYFDEGHVTSWQY